MVKFLTQMRHELIKIDRKYHQTLLSILLLCVVLFSVAGYYYGLSVQRDRYTSFLESFKNIRENSDKYKFINPLIGGVSAPATEVGIYSDIRDEIVSYLQEEKYSGDLFAYSFYFRDLGTGLWFGSNESADFFPASLFKLPIAISVYKEIEENPSFLKMTTVYTEDIAKLNNSVTSNAQSILKLGATYSVEELVEIMLTESDNGAKDLLLTLVDKRYLNNLFSVVSLVDPDTVKTYTISSRKYAHFLRILYGSSYLNEEHSEYLLKLLSGSDFKDGIVAGLPVSIPVSHKFGTYEFDEEVNGKTIHTQQLHDCGVVYHAQKPYVFCLMTKGKDLESLYKVIAHVSSLIYKNQESGGN